MTNQPVIDALNKALADTYTLYLKTQNFHWNVTGPNFGSLHIMFEKQYTELATAVDDIAERIRAVGAKAPGSFAAFLKLAAIKEAKGDEDAMTMVRTLHADHLALLQDLKTAVNAAEAAEDDGTASLISDRMTAHEKTAWMLGATAA